MNISSSQVFVGLSPGHRQGFAGPDLQGQLVDVNGAGQELRAVRPADANAQILQSIP